LIPVNPGINPGAKIVAKYVQNFAGLFISLFFSTPVVLSFLPLVYRWVIGIGKKRQLVKINLHYCFFSMILRLTLFEKTVGKFKQRICTHKPHDDEGGEYACQPAQRPDDSNKHMRFCFRKLRIRV
jgi:hypothetical protein